MALLPNITYAPGEPMQDAFDKQNAAIDTINLMGGGTTGQLLSKVNDDDFNFTWVDAPVVKFAVIPIGDWNMDADDLKEVDISAYPNPVLFYTTILSDTGSPRPLLGLNAADGEMIGGYGVQTSTTIRLLRQIGGAFDSTDYNSTSFNRGFITIGYLG